MPSSEATEPAQAPAKPTTSEPPSTTSTFGGSGPPPGGSAISRTSRAVRSRRRRESSGSRSFATAVRRYSGSFSASAPPCTPTTHPIPAKTDARASATTSTEATRPIRKRPHPICSSRCTAGEMTTLSSRATASGSSTGFAR